MSLHEGVHVLVRRRHEARVLAVLRQHGALSRHQIAQRVGLSRSTLSEIVGALLVRGAVVVTDTDAAHRTGSGRPAELLALDPASGQYMGVDFGLRRVVVVVTEAAHDVIGHETSSYPGSTPWTGRVARACEVIERLEVGTGVRLGALQAIGIGVPGWGDRFIPEEFGAMFAERYRTTAVVNNNGRLAGLAEALLSPGGATRDLVYLRLSDGVGGGLVLDGRLVHGSTGFAGALGHVTVEPGGALCRCGKRGCVETVASVPAILAACQAAGARTATLADLADAVERRDARVDAVLRRAGESAGRALATIAMAVNPAEIVIGGEVVKAAPVLLEVISAAVRGELSWRQPDLPLIRASVLGDDAGALGAIAAVYHESPLLTDYRPREVFEPSALARLRTS